MSALALRPPVEPADRLALTLCLAVIVHVMIVLGVGFAPEPAPAPRLQGLEVTLVSQRSEEPPEQADVLAQANLRGGGDSDEDARPTAPLATPLPAPTPKIVEPAPPRPAAKPAAEAARIATPTPAPADTRLPDKPVDPAPGAPAETALEASRPAPAAPALPTASQLITRSFALASLNSELQQKLQTHAKRPRQKYISANTQEYRYAAYMEAWRAKVERIGNINYPDEARQKKLSGALLLDVALRPDGSVIEILVRRSSGHKVLDDAAVRIVELAAPFAAFPEDIAREVDVLHVTRTWKFLNTDEFAAQ